MRAPTVASKSQFEWSSREMLLLVNNVVLLAAMLTVLFGTLFPLFMDALGFGKYSVGPPYFNAVFVPLMAILMVFMGVGPTAHWKKTRLTFLKAQLLMAAAASVVVGLVFPLFYGESYSIGASLAVCFASWLIFSCWVSLRDKLKNAATLSSGLARLGRSYYAMLIAHFGFALCVLGVCLTSQYSQERDLRMAPGDSMELAGYHFEFGGSHAITGPNYSGEEALIHITENNQAIATLRPQKRRYNAQREQMMTEAAIDAGFFRDLYVALGEPLGDGAWAVRVHYKPFVRWMWLGALFMGFGGVLAATDKRYRVAVRAKITNAAAASAA